MTDADTTTVALMWEAKAAPGRGAELLAWVRERPLDPAPLRRETFTAPGDRVLVITWWDGDLRADVPELPDPPAALTARPVHRWRFTQVPDTAAPAAPSEHRRPG